MQKYQTFGRRFFAMLIDLLLVVAFGYIDDKFRSLDLLLPISYAWLIISTFAFSAYFILAQGLYGQTLGKKIMKVKVVDLEENPITVYQAFVREYPNLILNFTSLFVLTSPNFSDSNQTFNFATNPIGNTIYLLGIAWGLTDIIVALMNEKCRALHDFIAGTVVIKIDS